LTAMWTQPKGFMIGHLVLIDESEKTNLTPTFSLLLFQFFDKS